MRQIPGLSDIPVHGWYPYSAIHRERIRAHTKHAEKGSMELVDWDSAKWLSVLVEEVGEIAKVINEFNLGNIDRKEMKNQLTLESIQTGAMISAWLDALGEQDG